jgi:hypothetical protein
MGDFFFFMVAEIFVVVEGSIFSVDAAVTRDNHLFQYEI